MSLASFFIMLHTPSNGSSDQFTVRGLKTTGTLIPDLQAYLHHKHHLLTKLEHSDPTLHDTSGTNMLQEAHRSS